MRYAILLLVLMGALACKKDIQQKCFTCRVYYISSSDTVANTDTSLCVPVDINVYGTAQNAPLEYRVESVVVSHKFTIDTILNGQVAKIPYCY